MERYLGLSPKLATAREDAHPTSLTVLNNRLVMAGFVRPKITQLLLGPLLRRDGVQHNTGVDHPDFQGVQTLGGNGVAARRDGLIAQNIFLPLAIAFVGTDR